MPIITKNVSNIKVLLRKYKLYSVCEEAQCPNLSECFNRGTATFMILGFICTRKCPFCAVIKGRPIIPDDQEPEKLYHLIMKLHLKYVVLTSVTRDDLYDGGAKHFYNCIRFIRNIKDIKIEILVPDFRKNIKVALKMFSKCPPDVFNHNIENVPRLYPVIRPGANYQHSLKLLRKFKKYCPDVPTKSGLMLGLGEHPDEVFSVLNDLKKNGVSIITIGQYMQPSKKHLPVKKYISPKDFNLFQKYAISLGFRYVFCGPLVRSSYHADQQVITL